MTKPKTAPGRRQAVLPRIRAYQLDAFESTARFKLLMCGRRWGKGKMALYAAAEGHGPMLERTGRHRWRGALQGARVGWVTPSDKSPASREAWNDIKAALGHCAVSISEMEKILVVPGGGSVQMLSGYDPAQLRGFFLDGVVVDECSLLDEDVWKGLRPVLSDYGGWALLLGNVPPDIETHWFVGLYRTAQTPAARARGWAAWRRPSWENPQLTEEDLDEARETTGLRVFQREYAAELVGVEGGVWREEWFVSRRYGELPDLERVVITLDAAWKTGVRNDFSVAQCWGRTATDYYLVGELRGKWESPQLRRNVSAFRDEWLHLVLRSGGSLPVYVESAGGGAVALQELRQSVDYPVLDFEVRGSSKMARHEAVSPLGEAGKVWVPHQRIAPWIGATLEELVGFPDLPRDDRGDAWTMALQVLKGYSAPALSVARAPRPKVPALIERGGYD